MGYWAQNRNELHEKEKGSSIELPFIVFYSAID